MANAYMAPIQPTLAISFCASGAKTNCPSDPPALIMPAACPRFAESSLRDTAPISTEKLPAPDPAADRRPSAITMPVVLSMKGVSAEPSASTTRPAASTRPGP
jgi:hypothetical protein